MKYRFFAIVLSLFFCASAAFANTYEDAISATMQNKAEDLEPILAKGFDPNTVVPGGTGDTLLIMAIRNNANRVVDLLLRTPKIKIDQPNALKETPLMIAVFLKENSTARKLISKGAKLNRPKNWSPLHYAASSGNAEMVKFLIQKGADVNARTLRGMTPLYMAARDADATTVKELLAAGARKDFCNNDERGPYDIAKERRNTDEVINLLKYDHCR